MARQARSSALVAAVSAVIEQEAAMLDAAYSLSGVAVFVNYDKNGGIRRVSLRPELDYDRERPTDTDAPARPNTR